MTRERRRRRFLLLWGETGRGGSFLHPAVLSDEAAMIVNAVSPSDLLPQEKEQLLANSGKFVSH